MKQWYYVKNQEGYIALEHASSGSEAKTKAAGRPGFDPDTTKAWPKACMPMGVDNMSVDVPTRKT